MKVELGFKALLFRGAHNFKRREEETEFESGL